MFLAGVCIFGNGGYRWMNARRMPLSLYRGWAAMMLCDVSCGWYVARGTMVLERMLATTSTSWLLWLAVAESAISVASSREVSGPHYGRIGALTAAGATMIG